MANVNCLRCRFRHEDNGNCTAVGGFCTAVPAAHCPLLRQYLDTGMTPEEVLPKDKADEIALKLMCLADLENLAGRTRRSVWSASASCGSWQTVQSTG